MRIRPLLLLSVAGGLIAALVAPAAVASAADPDTQPPSIGAPYAAAITSTTLTAAWGAGTDNVGITGYQIQLLSGTSGQPSVIVDQPASSRSWQFTGLIPGAGYGLGLRAVDAAGNWSTWIAQPILNILPTDVTPPTAPGTPVGSNITTTSFTVSWAPSTDNVGVTQYQISAFAYDYALSGQSTTTSYTFTNLLPGTTYSVTVGARDAAGNYSSRSAMVGIRTLPTDGTPPTAPGKPVVTAITAASATVSWAPSTDNVGVVRYAVFLAYSDVVVERASTTATTATINLLTPLTAYTVTVRAYDAAGNQASSPSTTFTTPPLTPTSCTATYRVVSTWPGYFQAEVTVRNSGTASIPAWQVLLTYPTGVRVEQLWGGTLVTNAPSLVVRNANWNGSLAPGQTATFGFNASQTSTPPVPVPVCATPTPPPA